MQENISLEPLKKAYEKLVRYAHNLQDDQDETAVVKSFEYSYELAWKALRRVLLANSIECKGSKTVFRKAGEYGYIDNVEKWLEFVELRNLTSHTYDEETVKIVIEKIDAFLQALKKLIYSLETALE